MELIKTQEELKQFLCDIKYDKPEFYIAVEALIFKDEKLVLLQRGPTARDEAYKLEGIGGRVHEGEENLLEALETEIQEEIGCQGLTVKIERLLEVRQVSFQETQTKEWKDWVIVSHLCCYQRGEVFNCEPFKHESIHFLGLEDLYQWQEEPEFDQTGRTLLKPGLSRSLVLGRETYRRLYGNRVYYEKSEQD